MVWFLMPGIWHTTWTPTLPVWRILIRMAMVSQTFRNIVAGQTHSRRKDFQFGSASQPATLVCHKKESHEDQSTQSARLRFVCKICASANCFLFQRRNK